MPTRYTFPRMPIPGAPIKAGWGDSLIRSVSALKPVQVPGMLISRGAYGTRMTPIATAAVSESAPSLRGLLPFDVRWYDFGDDKGEWQIYMPAGCLTLTQGGVTGPYIPVNDAAHDENGDAIAGWYKIPEPFSDAYADVVREGNRAVKSWAVYLLLKPWARVLVSVDPTHFGPVAWSETVATIGTITPDDEDGSIGHSAVRLTEETQIAKEWDISQPFSVRYDFSDEGFADKGATPSAMLTKQTRFIGRLQETLYEDTDVTGWGSVWVKITHDGETFETTVERDLSGGDTKSDDDRTVYRLYTLEGNVVTEDLRGSVPEMDFYTSPATAETNQE